VLSVTTYFCLQQSRKPGFKTWLCAKCFQSCWGSIIQKKLYSNSNAKKNRGN
jgi:hypothetical protein